MKDDTFLVKGMSIKIGNGKWWSREGDDIFEIKCCLEGIPMKLQLNFHCEKFREFTELSTFLKSRITILYVFSNVF